VVLVVDDSPEDAEVVRRHLRRLSAGAAHAQSYEVRHVQLGAEALAQVRDPATRPDVVLLDHGLPDLSGLELLELLAAEPGGAPVPVVMLTGTHAHIDTAVAAMRHGALDYLAKDALSVDALRRALDGARDRFASGRLVAAQREELERRHRALDAAAERTSRLLALVTSLGGALTPEEVAAVTLRDTTLALGASLGAVAELRPDGAAADGAPVLLLLGSAGLPDAVRRRWARVPPEVDVPATAAVRLGEPVWIESAAEAAARFADLAPARDALRYEAAATLPLQVHGRTVGVLALGFAEARAFAPDERAFLLTAARQCAQALERARLYAAAQAARTEAQAARAQAEDARADAVDANRAKSQFLANMSHELRTPLNAIGGYVQLLELGIHGPLGDAQRDALGRVTRAQQHLLGLITDVLNFAKLEAGRVEYHLGAVDLADVLADVVPLVEPQLAAKRIAFATPAADRATARVWADHDKLRQVLLNLLSNAVKFTPEGGRVEIDVAPGGPGDEVRVRVADTGIGIPADKLGAIFDPFVQVSHGRTRAHEGTGLGLAISRDLARGMGGDLTAESTPGAGSAFTVALRRARPGAEAPADAEAPAERRARGDRRDEVHAG
jgi:signal transduction histidine kinase/DNA-binding response OmpR family regulator